MLGTLFRIGQQFGGQRNVFFVGFSAASSAGQRADRHLRIDHADHHLGELPTSVTLGVRTLEHERAGIDHSQRAVDLKRVCPQRNFQPLADDDLEDIACTNVLDAFLDGLLEFRLGEVRLILEFHLAARSDVDQFERRRARTELIHSVSTRRHASS